MTTPPRQNPVEQMKKPALEGKGLKTYINQNVEAAIKADLRNYLLL